MFFTSAVAYRPGGYPFRCHDRNLAVSLVYGKRETIAFPRAFFRFGFNVVAFGSLSVLKWCLSFEAFDFHFDFTMNLGTFSSWEIQKIFDYCFEDGLDYC